MQQTIMRACLAKQEENTRTPVPELEADIYIYTYIYIYITYLYIYTYGLYTYVYNKHISADPLAQWLEHHHLILSFRGCAF